MSGPAESSIRRLTAEEVPGALELSSQAGWNQTASDWETIIELSPETSFAVDCGGQLASTATLLRYGERLAWVGMVLTRTDFQRRGFAKMLLSRVLAEADARGIRTVKLDATAQGQPIYTSLGFEVEQEVQRWSGTVGQASSTIHGGSLHAGSPSLDLTAFGVERSQLLRALARHDTLLAENDGFAMRRKGTLATYLGPCVSRSPESARRLIASQLATEAGRWFWDLLPANSAAERLAREFGFRVERRLIRMFRGEPLRGDESSIYAIAGFEFG
jgi:GNAT superfamily N-acetyltransferase